MWLAQDQELLYGASKAFRRVVDTAVAYASSDWPVLLLGETGVGKELMARHLHARSGRARAPFIPVNCAAIPHGLFESELFGCERGAFSGAVQSTRGLVRQAHGGTLFLDEIGELDLSLQGKLLRLMDSGEVRAVGSTRVEHVNVRIVAATHVNLFEAVAGGTFRLDLLERLSVLTLEIPPLRERRDDIPVIARGMIERLGAKLEEESLPLLTSYDWPGNARQMRNVLIRATVLGQSRVSASLLEKLLAEESARLSVPSKETRGQVVFLNGSLESIEKQVIVDRLKRCHGNRKRAAEELGIAKSTLHEKLRRWKMAEDGASWPVSRWGVDTSLGA